MPFSIAEIVSDPDFAQSFTIIRSSGGKYVMGKWQNATVTVNMWGSIQPPSATELDMVPEGDRTSGVIVAHSTQRMYETNVDDTFGISDLILWHDDKYRIMMVYPWIDYGYWKALAILLKGA